MNSKKHRIIPRLDVKGPNVVKGIRLEGLRVVGNPAELAKKYYNEGADEILYIDIVASLYERNNLMHIVEQTTAEGVYIPITVGGGIRTIFDIKQILRVGADKVAINTAATRNPNLIKEAARIFGSQCIVGSIEAKYKNGKWEAYTDNGREETGLDAIEWAKKLVELGAGEILITSVDRDGTEKGYDTELIQKITEAVSVPVIASGGAGSIEDIQKCFETNCDGLAVGTILHYNKENLQNIKSSLKNIPIRSSPKEFEKTQSQTLKPVSIIDYGAGNLKSVINAFQKLGNEVKIISTPEEIQQAELLVLPGDGAFGFGMDQLKKQNMIEAIQNYKKPLLGICLGMQLLMSESEEFGKHEGLNLIQGKVIPFTDKTFRVPHMGWNALNKNQDWNPTILKQIPNSSEVYFVHSFFIKPEDDNNILATTNYANEQFCSIIKKDNIYGCQFHPEKSGNIGLEILNQFSKL